MRYLHILLLAVLSTFAYANFESNVSHEGWVDGAEKWETPSHTTPYFSEEKEVEYGKKLTILTFFINPLVDKQGNVNITCGIKIIRPNNTVSIDNQNIGCVNGKFPGNPRSVYLSPVVIKYSGDAGDPPGKWRVEVSITDKNRDAYVPLKSQFTLVKKANKRVKSDAQKDARALP